jgi:hypothetical protein
LPEDSFVIKFCPVRAVHLKAWDVGILFRIRPGSQRPDDPRENEKFSPAQ